MKTKQVFLGICLLLCSTLFVSCEKEPVTDIGVIEKELKDVIRENNITTCYVMLISETGTYAAHKNASFEIKGGFLILMTCSYAFMSCFAGTGRCFPC